MVKQFLFSLPVCVGGADVYFLNEMFVFWSMKQIDFINEHLFSCFYAFFKKDNTKSETRCLYQSHLSDRPIKYQFYFTHCL